MNTQDYHKSITTTVSAEEAFTKISSVTSWWTPNIKGSAKHLNDVFTMFTERDTVTLQVVEVIPNKKLVWLVTDCQMLWLKDTTEWKNTRIVFEISEGNQQTRIDFTHVGLVPQVECYDVCEPAWSRHLNNLAVWIKTGISPHLRTLEKELFIKATPERVFRALTTKEDLERWFLVKAEVDLRPGGEIRFAWEPGTFEVGKILVLEPPHRLSYT